MGRPQPPDETYDSGNHATPQWAFFTIMALSILLPGLIWRASKKELSFEHCATFAVGMFIALLVVAELVFSIGLNGILIGTGIAIVVGLIYKLANSPKYGASSSASTKSKSPGSRLDLEAKAKVIAKHVAPTVAIEEPQVPHRIEIPSLPIQIPKFGTQMHTRFGIKLCGIEPGMFEMGSPLSELGHRDNEDLVRVKISRGFWIANTPCTQEQWKSIMGENPSFFAKPNHPVEQITWDEAIRFCELLTKIQHEAGELPLDMRWSLPTEAQWEYACRAGTKTSLNNGTNITAAKGKCANLAKLAWYSKNSDGMTRPVGQKLPNRWGLYDMHGNVWEWCLDFYHHSNRGGEDPCNLTPSGHRSTRGGGWGDSPIGCRSAIRHNQAVAKDRDFGFRPVICW